MTDLITVPVHTSGSIDDYFMVEGLIMASRTADAYKAMDRANKDSVCLWRLRQPLPVNSEQVRRFLNRLATIGDMDPPVTSMTTFGVDSAGIGFAVLPVLLGRSFIERGPDRLENERLFTGALRKTELLHRGSVVCGDLCAASFWADRFGETTFVAPLGAFDGEATAPHHLPPVETLHFVAPEQFDGHPVTAASDVFALGVLGYYLFTGSYPFGSEPPIPGQFPDISVVRPPADFGPHVPAWTNEVLLKCLQISPASRYQNAGEIMRGISELRQRLHEQHAPVNVRQDGAARSGASAVMHAPMRMGPTKKEQEPEVETVKPASRRPLALKLGGIVAVLALIVLGLTMRSPTPMPVPDNRFGQGLSSHIPAIDDPGIRGGISEIANPQADIRAKEKKIDEIANSDDPLVHELLVKIAADAPSPAERELAEKAILTRATRLGLKRSAEQVRQWLRASGKGEHPAGYASVLRSLDTTLPEADHERMLKEAYPTNPKVLLRLAAALAFDTKKLKEYQPVLVQFLSDQTGDDALQGYSLPALVLRNGELATIFADEALAAKDEMSNDDLLAVLRVAAERADQSLRDLALLAAERKIFSPLRTTYIKLVTSRDNLPKSVTEALIKASAGVLKKDDISVLGRWIDAEGERLLYAVCADDYAEDILLEAFDLLAGKSLTNPLIRKLSEWVRRDHWDDRKNFARAIGTLGMIDRVPDDQVVRVVDTFSAYLENQEILDTLLSLNNPLIVSTLITKYPTRLGLPTLLQLMSSPDREIRLKAVQLVSHWNTEVGVIKMAIDAWERETDPEVRKLYEERFWSIKERVRSQR